MSGAPSRGGRGLLWCAAVLAIAAVATPTAWLTGDLAPDDGRHLERGALILRAALLALAAFLALAPQFERPSETAAPPRREGGRTGTILAAILVGAALLRAFRLGGPLWFDEIWMLIDSVRPPLATTIRTFASDNNHPLYSVLATISCRLFGESEWALRVPAAAFGVASVAAAFAFARDRFGARTALVAAALVALSFHHVGFSQNARGYTGLLLFTLLSSHYLLRSLETGARRDWVLHGLCLALCVAVHLTGVFTAFGHVAVIAWALWKRPAWLAPGGVRASLLGLVLAALAALAAYALLVPQVVAFFTRAKVPVPGKAEWTDPAWFVTETARSFGLGVGAGLAVLAVVGVLALLGLVAAGRRSPPLLLLLLVPAFVIAAAMLGMGRNLWPRLFFFLEGFALLVAAEGALAIASGVAARLGRPAKALETAVIVLLLAGSAATLPKAYALPKQDFGAAREFVASARRPGDAVITAGMASYVYREYYGDDFVDVKTPEELAAALPPGRAAYVIYTFQVFVESRLPEVWKALLRDGREVARFRASIGGGDVVVLKIGN